MQIRVLEQNNNARGDLFGKLMTDVFHCLGYTDCRLNVHKSGREVDLQGRHRIESRIVVAECKATKDAIGGADVNKFAGVLDAERRKSNSEVEGYYVSLRGFTETAIEQEADLGSRLQLITGRQAVAELIRGRLLAPEAVAAAEAGRHAPDGVVLMPDATELLAHALGWVWAFYFGHQGVASHVCLVHADGQVLNSTLGKQLISSDTSIGGGLDRLILIAPPASAHAPEDALARYREHLQVEYGHLTLEGLPADTQVGGKSRRLESMFVPMDVEPLVPRGPAERVPFHKVLEEKSRIALVAPPGAGKSTLLKRLAVAYSSTDRLSESGDNLPNRDWLPVVVRCRQLGELTRGSILEVIESLPARAELPEVTFQFLEAITERLKQGNVLLLIDGLDEISDESDRLAFATQLRTFLGTYPKARMVVSSREVGFRAVAGALASSCSSYKLSELDDDDIRQLTTSWQAEFHGDGPRARAAAEDVTRDILSNDRVRALATNPLLLTTLLLVRRWLGELPRRRSALYGKAIEVLLMTWNIEGHEPLDQAEVLPQLSYVAFSMMSEGEQVLTAQRLAELLREARSEMPEELGGCRISVQDFVARVEERSSLLALAGHEVIDGQLRAVYEFRHLTFQEYLAALGIVNGWHPGRGDETDLVGVLSPYLKRATWREVIPLVAVLAGRHAASIVLAVASELSPQFQDAERGTDAYRIQRSLAGVLQQCLADDVPITPDVARIAADAWIRAGRNVFDRLIASDVFTGRHGPVLLEVAKQGLQVFDECAPNYGSMLGSGVIQTGLVDSESVGQLSERLLAAEDDVTLTALLCASMELAYISSGNYPGVPPVATEGLDSFELATAIHAVLRDQEGNAVVEFCGCWALAWLNTQVRWPVEARSDVFNTLCRIWMGSTDPKHRRQAAWALSGLRPLDRVETWPSGLEAFLAAAAIRCATDEAEYFEKLSVFVCRWLIGHYESAADSVGDFAVVLEDRLLGDHEVVKALSDAGVDTTVLLEMLERREAEFDIESNQSGDTLGEALSS